MSSMNNETNQNNSSIKNNKPHIKLDTSKETINNNKNDDYYLSNDNKNGLGVEITPIDKLNFKFEPSLDNAPFAVVISTGAFTPAHINHLHMLLASRKYLMDAKLFRVVGAYLSPSHQSYVDAKLKEKSVPLEARIEMSELAVSKTKFLMVDLWELTEKDHHNAVDVCNHIQKKITIEARKHNIQDKIEVVLAMGGDLLFRMQELKEVISKFYVLVMKREEENLEEVINKLDKEITEFDVKKRIMILPDKYSKEQIHNLSSTLIREKLLEDQSIKGLVPTPVIEYIDEHKLWNA